MSTTANKLVTLMGLVREWDVNQIKSGIDVKAPHGDTYKGVTHGDFS